MYICQFLRLITWKQGHSQTKKLIIGYSFKNYSFAEKKIDRGSSYVETFQKSPHEN